MVLGKDKNSFAHNSFGLNKPITAKAEIKVPDFLKQHLSKTRVTSPQGHSNTFFSPREVSDSARSKLVASPDGPQLKL